MIWIVSAAAVLALGAALSLPASSMVLAQGPGVLEGRVVNGTTGEPVSGADVRVSVFRRMTQITDQRHPAGPEGLYRLEGLPVEPDIRYIVSVQHQGVRYLADAVDPNQGTSSADVTVYETTTSSDAVSVLRGSVAVPSIDPQTGLLQVLAVVTFVNRGNRTYVGETPDDNGTGVLRVPLPRDALDLVLGDGFSPEGPIRTPEGVAGRLPLPPGESVRVFAYKLPYTGPARSVEMRYAYPVERATFVISTELPRPSSDRLTHVETVDINGALNFSLSAEDIGPGEPVVVTLSGLPDIVVPGSGGGGLDTALRGTGIGLLALLLAGSVLYTVGARRRGTAAIGGGGSGALDQERLSLVKSIAELDERFETGGIAEEHYERLRAGAKQRLMDILMLIREEAGRGNQE